MPGRGRRTWKDLRNAKAREVRKALLTVPVFVRDIGGELVGIEIRISVNGRSHVLSIGNGTPISWRKLRSKVGPHLRRAFSTALFRGESLVSSIGTSVWIKVERKGETRNVLLTND